MYGDPDVMRRHVNALREQAVDVRILADQLVAQTESIGWTGRAAESMRVRVSERATHLSSAAAQHQSAADALDRHLQAVEHGRETIANVERTATRLVAEARARIARIEQEDADQRADRGAEPDRPVVVREPEPDDVVLAAFEAPPSGHVDWLSVELPGL